MSEIRMNIAKGKIGNALTSTADNHIVAVSEDIYDEHQQEYQSDINGRTFYVETEEFIKALIDSEGKLIKSISPDGKITFYANLILKDGLVLNGNIIDEIENEEFIEVKLDSEGHILEAIYKDGTKYIPKLVCPKLDEIYNNTLIAFELDEEDGSIYGIFPDNNNIKDTYITEEGDVCAFIEEIGNEEGELFSDIVVN